MKDEESVMRLWTRAIAHNLLSASGSQSDSLDSASQCRCKHTEKEEPSGDGWWSVDRALIAF